ncbi:hypothetical protein NIES4071_109880 (plasmid) [Calothrix sp. NIES-4071]|nr:hypothetical protein NIES4071_109880 [Calothrix sp. NIES-4071]BAZ65247.1 hypothetical protein NIES4105_109800 [Calothrix sp. NIES-4105]
MPRGGARPNSGPQSSWNMGKTTSIRVPVVLAPVLLRIARSIDNDCSIESILSDEAIDRDLKDISGRLLTRLIESLKREFE